MTTLNFFKFMILVLFMTTTIPLPTIDAVIDSDAEELCKQSWHYGVCMECLKHDMRGSDDIPDVAYSILYCLYSQAQIGHELVDQMLSSTQKKTRNDVKNLLHICSAQMFSAADSFATSWSMIDGSDFKSARSFLEDGQKKFVRCFIAFSGNHTPIPQELSNNLDQIRGLYFVARFLFSMIKRIEFIN